MLTLSDFQYLGGFRIKEGAFGVSSANYSTGQLGKVGNSLLLGSHVYQLALGEFPIPTLSTSENLANLTIVSPSQGFTHVFHDQGLPASVNDRLGGVCDVNGELVVQAYKYYDTGGNPNNVLIAQHDLSLMSDGWYQVEGSGHVAMWMSEIPNSYKTILGGTHIMGASSGEPITSRWPIGPSAFVVDASDFTAPGAVPSTVLLDFDLQHPLAPNLLSSDMWTHISRAVYGVIIGDTYLTIGRSGGHVGGVQYKGTQSDGRQLGGYGSTLAEDFDNHYWLWDMADLVAVRQGLKQPHELRPYEQGPFPQPFRNVGRRTQMIGATYDAQAGILYASISAADTLQGRYAVVPVIVAYKVTQGTVVEPPVVVDPPIIVTPPVVVEPPVVEPVDNAGAMALLEDEIAALEVQISSQLQSLESLDVLISQQKTEIQRLTTENLGLVGDALTLNAQLKLAQDNTARLAGILADINALSGQA